MVGLVGKAFASQLDQIKEFEMGTLVAALLNTSIVRLVPGLVGQVSVYCDWVGYLSRATLDFPVWQHAFNCLSSTVSILPKCVSGTIKLPKPPKNMNCWEPLCQ